MRPIVLIEVLDGGTCFNFSDIIKGLLRGYHRDQENVAL